MKRYGFFLKPGKLIYKLIKKEKSDFWNFNKDQKYLDDPPHLTLFHGYYNEPPNRNDGLEDFLYTLSAGLFEYNVSKSEIFYDDILRGWNTFIYLIDNPEKIQNIQKKLITKIPPEKPSNFNIDNLNPIYRKNLKKHNYPFVGKNYIPHFTICNMKINKTNKICVDFKKRKTNIVEKFNSLYIAEIIDNKILKEDLQIEI